MLEFIQEISEARLYKNGDTLKGKSINDVAKITFLNIMILEIMRTIKPEYAKQYASNTFPYQHFSSMRTSASDLHNLLVVIDNQDKFQDKLTTNKKYSSTWPFTQSSMSYTITLPELQIKRYLRDIQSGTKNISQDRQLFKTLEDNFHISDSNLKNIRRNVADWKLASPVEKETTIIAIKQLANNLNQQNDLYQYFKNLV